MYITKIGTLIIHIISVSYLFHSIIIYVFFGYSFIMTFYPYY